jgi:hypothetical protein
LEAARLLIFASKRALRLSWRTILASIEAYRIEVDMSSRKYFLGIGAAIFSVMLAGHASAGNLVVNGGFETGDFTGWTVIPNGGTIVAPDGYVYNGMTYHSHSGDYFAALGSASLSGSVSQSLSTTAGQSYTISLWLASDGLTANEFKVLWDGSTLSDQTNIPAQGYLEQSYTVQGTGTDTLMFYGGDGPGYLSLDDVSVVAAGSAVPEPASFTLLALGIASIAGYGWRRRNSASA